MIYVIGYILIGIIRLLADMHNLERAISEFVEKAEENDAVILKPKYLRAILQIICVVIWPVLIYNAIKWWCYRIKTKTTLSILRSKLSFLEYKEKYLLLNQLWMLNHMKKHVPISTKYDLFKQSVVGSESLDDLEEKVESLQNELIDEIFTDLCDYIEKESNINFNDKQYNYE